MNMARQWSSGEPARQPDYRNLYMRALKFEDRLAGQDGCITWLLVELRALQKRIAKLEQRNDDLAAAAVRLAHSNMDEVREGAQP